MISVCFISNNASRLRECIQEYAQEFDAGKIKKKDFVFIVIDTQTNHAENMIFLKKFASKNALRVFHASNKEFLELIERKINPVAACAHKVFEGRYGGSRNACLLISALLGAHAVFFDDDTRPANDCLARYEKLFVEGKEIVCGKYLGHAGGTTALVLELVKALEDFKDGKNARDETIEHLKKVFCGLPQETSEIILGAGFNGGNAGIHASVLQKYCFFPTHYRIEDGVFSSLAGFFLNQVRPVYSPRNEKEAAEKLPVVFHERKSSDLTAFCKKLVNELKGNSVALIILKLLQEKKRVEELEEKELIEWLRASSKQCFDGLLLNYLQEKTKKLGLTEAVSELGDEEIKKEFNKILSIALKQMAPNTKEALEQIKLFFFTQDNWSKILEAAKQTNLIKEISCFK